MINNEEFTKRLKKVMEHQQLSASMFADKVGVQRSSISHSLSGRNKPSLDFILKVTSEFKNVSIEWLLNGKGVFPKNENTSTTSTSSLSEHNSNKDEKKIARIVVFYSDGTFEEFKK